MTSGEVYYYLAESAIPMPNVPDQRSTSDL